jgi:hypothetical protein
VANERPLADFRGVFHIDEETGTEEYVYGEFRKRHAKEVVSALVQAACIFGVVFCATYATAVQGRDGNWISWMSWKTVGSLMNLFIIQVFGRVYQSVADKLTSWQNYRTRTEVANAEILKNSLFQSGRANSGVRGPPGPLALAITTHFSLCLRAIHWNLPTDVPLAERELSLQVPVHQQLFYSILCLLHGAVFSRFRLRQRKLIRLLR